MLRYVCAIGLFSVLLGGCHAKSSPTPAASAAPAPYRVSLTIAPMPIASLDLKTFTVRVADRQGRPVTGARVSVALVMPTMDMGRNEFPAAATAPGVYVGHGRFTMMGDWNTVVTVAREKQRVVQSFPVTAH